MLNTQENTPNSTGTDHSVDDIIKVFREVHEGKCTNASFSHANVVIISKEYYSALQHLAFDKD